MKCNIKQAVVDLLEKVELCERRQLLFELLGEIEYEAKISRVGYYDRRTDGPTTKPASAPEADPPPLHQKPIPSGF